MQIFRPGADTVLRVALSALAASPVLLVGLAYGLTTSPYVTAQDLVREQPVPFSHEHHFGRAGITAAIVTRPSKNRAVSPAFPLPKRA